MTCSHCGSDNPAGKKFCGDCGGALENRCPQCGAENPASKKFCGDCGAAFVAQPARAVGTAEARKVVTIVFADLVGSTSLHERLDAESVTRLMESYYRAMRGAVERHGGTVVKVMGDGVMAAFGVPRVAEDDAIRAVHAGVAMQDAFRVLARDELAAVGDIGLRVGINTGEVVVSADHTDVVGDPVNVAARLQAEAQAGEVVIGESTRRLVAALITLAPLGSFALKGRAEAMKAYRVVSLERPTGAATAAFVGRDDELARITAVYEAACAKPAARLAVLLGSPGLGKSRLIAEVTRRLGDAASVVTAHCDASGGATFAPVAAALRELFQIEAAACTEAVHAAVEAAIPTTDTERTRIAGGIAALLAGSPASPEETFFVIRRFLAGLAATKPVVLVIDDLHWAEPLLLDLVEHLVQWGSGVPLLVLVGARPELRDLRSSLVTPGILVADVVTLAGLDAGAAMRLAANVIGAAYAELDARYDVLEAALRPRVTAAWMAQRRPFLDRDWDAFAATHAADLVCHDHRLLGWGTLHGVDAYLRTQQVLVELAPNARARINHVITSEHGYLRSALIFGTRDGGAFELAFLRVDEIDAAGKVCRIDLYDADKVDEARARFAELRAGRTP